MKTDSVKKTSACCGSQAEPQASTCCGPEASSCCGSQTASCCNETKKTLNIDFLYLDLNTCERCIATDATLKEALGLLSCVFDTLGFEIKLNTVNITSKELAEKYRFVSSPTIRVNGVDICNELDESNCADCSDLAGCSVDCRVFVYEGKSYEQPPAAMIADGILKVIYGQKKAPDNEPYNLPGNLEKYFAGINSCCDSECDCDSNSDCDCGCDCDCSEDSCCSSDCCCDCDDTECNTDPGSAVSIKKMFIYEPALCCETGVCGVSVDPELLRISTVANNLKKNGVTLQRYNLKNYPQEFVSNTEINKILNSEGVNILPVTVVDGKIVKTKTYPTNGEIVMWLDISPDYLLEKTENSDCGCSSGSNTGKKGCC